MMPAGGSNARAKALATLQGMHHDTLCQPQIGEWLNAVKNLTLDSPWQTHNLRWMERLYRHATALPTTLVQELTETKIHSEQAWRSLRGQNNWNDFLPFLEKILSLTRDAAQI